MALPCFTNQEKYVLLEAITERIENLELEVKAASEELLLLQTLQKKIKATV